MSKSLWPYRTQGIPDDFFIRGSVPMTKEEVRAVTLGKLRLLSNHIVYDIGAGTGSISIEAALQVPEGKVYAVERTHEGIELIEKNIKKFGLQNVAIISGEAPEALKELPNPDRVIIGGSGGRLKDILNYTDNVLKPGGRLVANAILLETLGQVLDFYLANGYLNVDVAQITIAKGYKAGDNHLLKSINPVFVLSGEKPEK